MLDGGVDSILLSSSGITFYFILFWLDLHSLWNLSSLTRDQTGAPGRKSAKS